MPPRLVGICLCKHEDLKTARACHMFLNALDVKPALDGFKPEEKK